MYIELLKGILSSNIAVQEKLEKIAKIVERAEEIENRATEYAAIRARFNNSEVIEPTWDDRLKAVDDLKKKAAYKEQTPNNQELKSVLDNAVSFLKQIIIENGGWEIREPFEPFVPREKPNRPSRPLEMLLVAPWEIGLCISTLYDWLKSVQPEDKEALELIGRGNRYLRRIQLSRNNGGLGDSFWMEGALPSASEATGNTLETGMAVGTWILENAEWPAEYHNAAIEEGINYLESAWNGKDDGGWGFKPSWNSDIKSTAMVVMILLTLLIRLQPSVAERMKYWELSKGGLKWILRQQRQDGSWEYEPKSRDSRVSASFYAIQTMTLALFHLEGLNFPEADKMKEEMASARWKALRWYERSQKFISGSKGGWGWYDRDQTSAVEETAASLIVLLDTGMLSEESPMAEQAMKWLLSVRNENSWWEAETAIVVKASIRMLYKMSRMKNKLQKRSQEAGEATEGSVAIV